MPDQPDLNKRVLSVRILREDYKKLQKAAAERKRGFNEYIRHIINEATHHVELTHNDYQIITSEKNCDVKRKNTKRGISATRKTR